jgi:hypothetical protein
MEYEELKRRVDRINQLAKGQREKRKKLPEKQQWKETLEEVHLLLLEQYAQRQERGKKIKEGLANAKARGQKLGGARRKPKVPLEVLRALDKEGWTQTKIAKKFGISQGWVSQQLKKGRKTK